MSSKPTSLGYIDFAIVKAAVSLEQILERYGILQTLQPSGSIGLRGCCPIHRGDDPKEFSVTLTKNLWKCFSQCQRGGNHLDFVAVMEGCTHTEAAWKLNEWFNLGQEKQARARPSSFKEQRRKSEEASAPPEKKHPEKTAPKAREEPIEESGENKPLPFNLQNLDPSHPYLIERGLSPETLAEFGVGFCPKGTMAGRVVIPIHNRDAELIAYAGRWPGDPPEGKGKYRLPGRFKKSLELFNAHRAFEEPALDPLIIVEGFFDAMHLWQHGYRKVVALMGSSLSQRQEELIATEISRHRLIVLLLDNDEAGREARANITPRLARHCFVHSWQYPEGQQEPTALTPDQIAGFYF